MGLLGLVAVAALTAGGEAPSEHLQSGLVSAELLKKCLIGFTFVADSTDVLLMKPECEELVDL